jgi:hypothetical protein
VRGLDATFGERNALEWFFRTTREDEELLITGLGRAPPPPGVLERIHALVKRLRRRQGLGVTVKAMPS